MRLIGERSSGRAGGCTAPAARQPVSSSKRPMVLAACSHWNNDGTCLVITPPRWHYQRLPSRRVVVRQCTGYNNSCPQIGFNLHTRTVWSNLDVRGLLLPSLWRLYRTGTAIKNRPSQHSPKTGARATSVSASPPAALTQDRKHSGCPRTGWWHTLPTGDSNPLYHPGWSDTA